MDVRTSVNITFEANKYWTNTDKKNTGGELHHISYDLLSSARHKSYRPFQTQFAARLICLLVHKWKRSKNCHPSRKYTSFRGEFWFALAASFMLFTGFELASPEVNRITFIRGKPTKQRKALWTASLAYSVLTCPSLQWVTGLCACRSPCPNQTLQQDLGEALEHSLLYSVQMGRDTYGDWTLMQNKPCIASCCLHHSPFYLPLFS